MSDDLEESGTGRKTVVRTIRLSTDVLARLQVVADHLGVTVGAYITQEVGRALAKDEISLSVKQTGADSLALLAKLFEQEEQPTK